MRNRIFAVLALAILAGGGLAYGTFSAINTQPVKTVAAPTDPVVVAAANLPLGAELKKEDLNVVNFPKGQTPEGAFARKEDIIGRGLIVLDRQERADPGREARVEGSRCRACRRSSPRACARCRCA